MKKNWNWEKRMTPQRSKPRPQEKQRHSKEWFIDNGCELVRPSPVLFSEIYEMSGGEPCKECNCKSTCPAWPKV